MSQIISQEAKEVEEEKPSWASNGADWNEHFNCPVAPKKTEQDYHLLFEFIDTCAGVSGLVGTLAGLPADPPQLYLDIEGVNLSRYGTVSILQIYVSPRDKSYLVDIHTLGEKAFSTTASNGQTLRDILQSPTIPKVFFDVRNDSDALYSHFNVKLEGIHDIQVMELTTRRGSKSYDRGLADCIKRDAGMSSTETALFDSIKARGKALFLPEKGGSFEVFNARPLSEDLARYCVQDVRFLPNLWKTYYGRLAPERRNSIKDAVKHRIAKSQSPRGKQRASTYPGETACHSYFEDYV